MDPVLAPFIAAGFAGMWFYLKTTNDARLAERDATIAKLEKSLEAKDAKIESLQDIVGRNTSALDRLAPALESLVAAQRTHYQSRSTATVSDPAISERGS